MKISYLTMSSALACAATSLSAQDNAEPKQGGPPPGVASGQGGPPPGVLSGENVFDGDWFTIGIGAGFSSSYDGSNDYTLIPAPIVQGRLGGIGISPQPAGIALDLTPQAARGQSDFAIGPAVRFRNDRADNIEDEVVKLAGELDSAFEVGFAASYSIPGVFTRMDSLSLDLGARWDVAGAHDGMVIEPRIAWSRPIGRGTFQSISVNAEIVDDSFADYYYSVSPAQSAASDLTEFSADGGLNSLGATAFTAFDLDGNALNGGFSIVSISGYSRLVGDSADTPYTALRGDPNQFFIAIGVGYTF